MGESIKTTVDSELAQYYFGRYLAGDIQARQTFDMEIHALIQRRDAAGLTRAHLRDIARDYSLDFSALYFAGYLLNNPVNYRLQKIFQRYLKQPAMETDDLADLLSEYRFLFVPGWDYVESGAVTGSDLLLARKIANRIGVEQVFVDIPPHGGVRENARFLANYITSQNKPDKQLIIVGASSAGPAIHLALGKYLADQPQNSVKAWLNVAGILRGSPLIGYYQQWPQCWLYDIVTWFKGWSKDNIQSMSAVRGRNRFNQISIRSDVLIINYLGIPLSGQLSERARDTYPLLAPHGPNDGLTLLSDSLVPDSQTIIALGRDHFLADDPRIGEKIIALMFTMLTVLDRSAFDS